MGGNHGEGFEESEYSEQDLEGLNEEDFSEFDGQDGDAVFSEAKPLGGIYSLFETVLNKKDPTKVSNLNEEELGSLGISVRNSMRIALLGDTFGHKKFAQFFRNQAKIIQESSMSKEGWFTELFVTSKKYASRESSSSVKATPQYKKGKWKMFSKGQIEKPL